MTSDVRRRWQELRSELDRRAVASKDSQAATLGLSRAYRRLEADERLEVDALICAWLSSADEALRFDAIALVDAHTICCAAPALRDLVSTLDALSTPGAIHEAMWVRRVLRDLDRRCTE